VISESCSEALTLVESEPLLSLIKDKDDILVIYELVMMDLAYLNHQINLEELKALASKHDILDSD